MYMSAELIATLSSFIMLGIGMLGALAWLVRRIDAVEDRLGAKIDAGDEKLGARIDGLDEKLSARIDAVEDKLGARIDGLAGELTEVKIAVARLEGPPRHLLPVR
ncbi:hypothetical protein WDU99_13165 [Microbacterium sp. Mu-80]|uniref:Response regulator n=1 Tax=Microbacterium bandirmense TaxID=3122050 RepID=A0ABU8LE20_9MICO